MFDVAEISDIFCRLRNWKFSVPILWYKVHMESESSSMQFAKSWGGVGGGGGGIISKPTQTQLPW